jgi:hypothetical protein
LLILLCIFITGCTIFIDSISQPEKVKSGQQFRIRIDGHIVGESRESGSDKVYLYLTIPKDWEMIGIYFTGSYSGTMVLEDIDSTNHTGYYTYKWKTNTAYPYYPGARFSAFIEIKTGKSKGKYAITYLTGFVKNRDAYWGPKSLPIEVY